MFSNPRTKRLISFATAALAGYATALGFGEGAGVATFLVIGAVFEIAFWKELLFK